MPSLTSRRDPDTAQETWLIYYGDVHVGAISERTGNPHDTEPWEWQCGFYPGSRPGECTSGTAETFDQARADFEAALRAFRAKRTEAMKGYDPDGIVQAEAHHFMKCPACGQWSLCPISVR